jgi:DNA repair exonuclease SbcCD ATPase subunit
MATSPIELKDQTVELSRESFGTFCKDISGMFGAKMQHIPRNICYESVTDLKKRLGELVAVSSVKAEGTLNGTFQVVFGRRGLFIVGGMIAMPDSMTSLYEKCVGPKKILENIKCGSLKEAEGMSDILAEACNLIVGSWDKVFREGLEGHGHFVQTTTFVGNPWDTPVEKIGLSGEEKIAFIPFKVKVGPYPPFSCGVIFPRTIFGELSDAEAKAWAEAEAKTKVESEVEAKAEAEAKAKAETEAKARAEAKAKAEVEAKARAQAKAKTEAEAKAKAETEAKAEAKAKAETEAKAKAEAEAKAKAETEAKAKAEAEAKAKAETEAKAKAEAEAKAKAESEANAKAEAEVEAEAKAKAEAEAKVKSEAERVKVEAEKAKAEAEKAKAEAEKAKAEAEKVKAEAEKAKAEVEKAKAEAEMAKIKVST